MDTVVLKSWSASASGGKITISGLVISDTRQVYRPGETVKITGIKTIEQLGNAEKPTFNVPLVNTVGVLT